MKPKQACHDVRSGKPAKGYKKIGPFLHVPVDCDTSMQRAYDTDLECGCHWMANEKSDLLAKEFPTVCAMAELIEKERNRLRRQVSTLLRILKARTTKERTA